MYKDWRLRNSTELWRSNTNKQSSGNAGPKLQQKSLPARGILRNESGAYSCDALEPSVSGKVSPDWRTGGRCRSTSSSWNSCLPSSDSDVTCGISGESAHVLAEDLCQELPGEGRERPPSAESDSPVTPRRHQFVGQTEGTILLPITVKDIAVHPVLEDSQERERGSTNSSSKGRHVQWQVSQPQLLSRNSSAEAWTDLAHGEATRAERDAEHLDPVQAQNRETKWTPSEDEDCEEEMKVVAERKFGQPLNKFISGGPLHALASLTQLDFSKVDGPRAASGDLQEELEQNSQIQEQQGVSQDESMDSYNSGPFLPEKPNNKMSFPASDRMSSCVSKSEGHNVLMRANETYEPVVKEQPVITSKTVTVRKKIKMKAPTPKLSSRAKKPTPNVSGAKDISVIQADEQLREENILREQCSGDDCIEVDAADVQSLRSENRRSEDEVPKDERFVAMDTLQSNTCVITHCEHSIDVPELQDPPSRRRWPKVSPTFSSNRNDTERSSTSSTSESLQEERIPNGLHLTNSVEICDPVAVEREGVINGEPISPSPTFAVERMTNNGSVSVEAREETNAGQFKDRSDQVNEQQDFSTKCAVGFKTGLRISIPPTSVREISIDSASKAHQRTLPDSKEIQGEDCESKMFGDKLQSNVEVPSSLLGPSPRTYGSGRTAISEQQKETRESSASHESNSCPLTNLLGLANGSSEASEALDCTNGIPQRKREDPSDESSLRTHLVSNKDSTAAIDPPALSLATKSPGQPRRITQESSKFGRVWSSTPRHEETFAERASLSSQKLCNILSYLGHVEESNLQENFNILQKTKPTCYSPSSTRSPRTVLEHDDSVSLADSTFTTTLTTMSNRSATESNTHSRDGDGNRKSTVSLFEGVRKKIQHYKDRITGQESQNAQLIKELERVTADKQRALALERERFGKELETRASEYKTAIQHHLALNEKMIKDKEVLSEKCCNLAGILSTAESKFEEKLKVLQERAAQELKKQKELWIAGEKPRREAWKETKLKEIKEITIKGLEPHIEGIVEKHKQEIQKLETRSADEQQKRLELQAIQHRQEMCELRERLLKDRDDLLEKERMSALQRMNEVAEKYEQQAMQLRIRVSGDMATELERAEESRRKDKYDAHELLSKIQKEAAEREDTLRKGLENAMQDAVSKKDDEIVKLKNDWQTALDQKVREVTHIREKELQARCTKERDEQIEMIIERMDMEKDEAVTRQQQELLVKVERLMEEKLDFMKRMKEVESKCATLCQLSLEAKQKAEMELDNRDLQIESLETELGSQSAMIAQLKAQINQEKSNLTQQEERFESRIKKEKELVESALEDVERCNAEAQQMRARKVEELAEVEAHVRQAIDNKDLVIAGLMEQLTTAREQIRHTEQLLAS